MPKGTLHIVYKRIWALFIPPKISLFIGWLFHDAIPTDMNIRIHIASRCCYCKEGNIEDVEHILLRNELAKYIWGHFVDTFEVRNPRFYNKKTIF